MIYHLIAYRMCQAGMNEAEAREGADVVVEAEAREGEDIVVEAEAQLDAKAGVGGAKEVEL